MTDGNATKHPLAFHSRAPPPVTAGGVGRPRVRGAGVFVELVVQPRVFHHRALGGLVVGGRPHEGAELPGTEAHDAELVGRRLVCACKEVLGGEFVRVSQCASRDNFSS